MIRNIPRIFSSTTTYNKLGRWKLNDNIQRKIDLANIDNCGDRLCGIPISSELIDKMNKQKIEEQKIKAEKKEKNRRNKTIENLVNDYNQRWKQNITVEDFKKNFTRIII